jgi:uncharacterized iron-regulated membrane protein
MRAVKLSRKIHKWIALVIGIQLFLWTLSGFYMVVVNIDIIHGDMLVKNMAPTIEHGQSPTLPIEDLLDRFPSASKITLKTLMERPVYLVQGAAGTDVLDAETGEQLSPLNRQLAIQIAKHHYAGTGEISTVALIEDNPPTEIKFFPLPLWRIDFDDAWGSSFYVDPQSGRFRTRRHTLWRVFDIMFMLHIMDYDERDNVNNTLLRIFSILGVVLGSSGLWLLFYSFKRARAEDNVQ